MITVFFFIVNVTSSPSSCFISSITTITITSFVSSFVSWLYHHQQYHHHHIIIITATIWTAMHWRRNQQKIRETQRKRSIPTWRRHTFGYWHSPWCCCKKLHGNSPNTEGKVGKVKQAEFQEANGRSLHSAGKCPSGQWKKGRLT